MEESRSQGFTGWTVPEAYERFLAGPLFEPWAATLVARAGLHEGDCVLDVASGVGPVARMAAAAVTTSGAVVASDISAAMLALARAKPVDGAWAPIAYRECPAGALAATDGEFDAVLCQHGLQFFPDAAAAVREMARVVRPGGTVTVSTWSAEEPLGLFGPMAEVLAEAGLPEPYPRAFDPSSYVRAAGVLGDLLAGAGLGQISVERREAPAVWPSLDEAVSTMLGTPYGPLLAGRPEDEQTAIRGRFAQRLAPGRRSDGTVSVLTFCTIARGHRPGTNAS